MALYFSIRSGQLSLRCDFFKPSWFILWSSTSLHTKASSPRKKSPRNPQPTQANMIHQWLGASFYEKNWTVKGPISTDLVPEKTTTSTYLTFFVEGNRRWLLHSSFSFSCRSRSMRSWTKKKHPQNGEDFIQRRETWWRVSLKKMKYTGN